VILHGHTVTPPTIQTIIMQAKTSLRLLSISTIATSAILFASCGEKKAAGTEAGTQAPEAEAYEVDAETQAMAESLTDELIAQLNEFADAMISATDRATAEASVEKLGTVADAIADIAARINNLKTPDEATRTRLREKMMQANQALDQRLIANMQNMMNDEELSNIMGPALMEFQSKLSAHEKTFNRLGISKQRAR
jgi:hypothetical protein